MSAQAPAVGGALRALDRVRRRTRTPAVILFDVEPDPRLFDPREPPTWSGFERILERLPALRERLMELTGEPVAFTWLLRMDVQIAETWGSADWVADTYHQQLASLVDAGDELGVHSHPWRWLADEGTWIADYADPSWGEHCLSVSLDAFERSFGRTSATHKGGDGYLNGRMLACLGAAGVTSDFTVEPGRPPVAPAGDSAQGTCPDYRGIPLAPYRSSPDRFPQPDAPGSGPTIAPLLTGPGRRNPLRRTLISLEGSPHAFAQRLGAQLLLKPPPLLAMAVRSDAPLGGGWEALETNLEHLARHREVPLVTATEGLELLLAAQGAGS